MLRREFYIFCLVVGSLSVGSLALNSLSSDKAIGTEPKSSLNANLSPADTKGKITVVFAGGCFWGMEAVFEHLKGVTNVVSGYSGGTADTANYGAVSAGRSNHAEAIQITYDPAQISYEDLLKVYFLVAHNPTQLNYQGPDRGPQYRSAIFFANAEQKQIAEAYIARLEREKAFSKPIVTQVVPLQKFYAAEDYHQDFITHNPTYPYVVVHDLPKLAQLQKQFPSLYR
jgi:peptide-methionine (S)-S-oxide reductase